MRSLVTEHPLSSPISQQLVTDPSLMTTPTVQTAPTHLWEASNLNLAHSPSFNPSSSIPSSFRGLSRYKTHWELSSSKQNAQEESNGQVNAQAVDLSCQRGMETTQQR